MKRTTVDFLVSAVDNFGDVGFALDLAEALVENDHSINVRFFCNDGALFDRLCAKRPPRAIKYRNLSEYGSEVPSGKIVSFFDRIFPSEHIGEFAFPKKIILLSYLRFDEGTPETPGVGSLNGTRYRIGDDEYVHLVPSPLPEGAGVIVRGRASKKSGGYFPALDSEPGKTGTSVFCYPETKSKIRRMKEKNPEMRFVGFGDGAFDASFPFLRFDEYADCLSHFDSNVVRGENSAIMALLAGKPFLWDFYKESNGAHKEKIGDFLRFLRPHFADRDAYEEYALSLKSFNSKHSTELDVPLWIKTLTSEGQSLRLAFESAARSVAENDLSKTIAKEWAERGEQEKIPANGDFESPEGDGVYYAGARAEGIGAR